MKYITKLTKDRIEEAASLAYELNKDKETRCMSMSQNYDEILSRFNRYLEGQGSDFLLYIENDEIVGICNLDPDEDIRYVQTAGGIFAKRDFERIANEFYSFLIDQYKGYEFYSSYSGENRNAKDFWLGKGAEVDLDASIYEAVLKNVEVSDSNVEDLRVEDFDEFTSLHNQENGDAYWNSDKMIVENKLQGGFKVQVLKEDKITGYIASRFGEKYAETYFIYACDNSVEMYEKLLIGAFITMKEYYTGVIQYFADRDEINKIKALENVGWNAVATSTTYHFEKL